MLFRLHNTHKYSKVVLYVCCYTFLLYITIPLFLCLWNALIPFLKYSEFSEKYILLTISHTSKKSKKISNTQIWLEIFKITMILINYYTSNNKSPYVGTGQASLSMINSNASIGALSSAIAWNTTSLK